MILAPCNVSKQSLDVLAVQCSASRSPLQSVAVPATVGVVVAAAVVVLNGNVNGEVLAGGANVVRAGGKGKGGAHPDEDVSVTESVRTF